MAPALRYQVERWLRTTPDVDFPATRGDILATAERAGAPVVVADAIRALPPELYGRRDDVVAAAAALDGD